MNSGILFPELLFKAFHASTFCHAGLWSELAIQGPQALIPLLKIGVEKLNYISREDRRREIRREKEEEFQREEGKVNERD